MSFNQTIKGTVLPKVPLKTLFEEDTSVDSQSDASRKAPKYMPDSGQLTGAREPYVKIGGQIVKGIDMLTIDETGFIPTVSMTFVDPLGEFAGDYFPKTNLIMNVYLKSGSEKFKPIRCDFLIKSVKSIPPKFTGKKDAIAMGTTYMVKGELYIPNIYRSISKSYAKLNSKDALKKICDELGLGFAENESKPADSMTWINTNMSNLQFIQKIVEHSYQSDDTFFMAFIDKYYYLNFIEVNEQLKVGEAQKTFITSGNALLPSFNQRSKDDAGAAAIQDDTTYNYLTTEVDYKNSINYIHTLNLVSAQGDVLKNQGYKKEIYYYDHLKKADTPRDKFINFFMAPLRSQDRDTSTFLIPEEQSLAENKIKKWMNIDYGNTHIHWNAARVINNHNLKELEKIKLKVVLNNINFQAIRGFMIPVAITIQQAEKILKSTESGDEANQKANVRTNLNDQAIDEQLTGYYYISGAKYHYDALHPNGLYTELFLARREWRPSKKTS
jgi:hypothetical protein